MGKKVLIVGGVAGGASVATRIRRLDEEAEIIMFERGPHVSYSNCALPYYLSRTVIDSAKLVLMNPEKFQKQYNIEARVNQEVIKILPSEKSLQIKNLTTGEIYAENYDTLYLSPGAAPIRPNSIEGIDQEHVFCVRNVVDITAIDNYLAEHNVQDVAVIGAGFIGVEIAENLQHAGKKVSLVEAMDQIMAPFDNDMAQLLHKELFDQGVTLVLQDKLASIHKDHVALASGKTIRAGAVILAMGVRPETALAKEAGIELGETGGIKVDHQYHTSIKDIYALGDAVEVHHMLAHKKTLLPLAWPAQQQAREAADDNYGRITVQKGFMGSSVVRIFNLNGASTGLNEKECRKNQRDYDFVYVIHGDRVALIPGASPIHLKLIFEVPTGKILGAQAIGKGAVDKRIDVIATLISMDGTLEDLKNLELCYAPPFGTAKDVVNQAALVGLNILNGEYRQVPVTKVRELVEEGAFIIDVRERNEYEVSHLVSAVNIPMSEFRKRLQEIPKDRPLYLHCRSGQRSYNVVRALGQLGYDQAYNIAGSMLGVALHQYYEDKVTGRKPIVTDYEVYAPKMC